MQDPSDQGPAVRLAVPSGAGTMVPAGHWTIDPEHSSVNFAIRHLGITTLRGRFAEFTGSVESDGAMIRGTGVVDAKSVHTGSDARDRHLLSPDFLNADQHPRMTFEITKVRANHDDYIVEGEITINGVTRPIVLEAFTGGVAKDPYGHDRCGLELRSEITRRDFEITFDPSGILVGEAIALEIDLSLMRSANGGAAEPVAALPAAS
jgi:polyisoprenoid-binding protein YceI